MSKKKIKKKLKKKNKLISLSLLLTVILISGLISYLLKQTDNKKAIKNKSQVVFKQEVKLKKKKKYLFSKNKFPNTSKQQKIIKPAVKTITKKFSFQFKKNAKIKVEKKLLNLSVKKTGVTNPKIAIIIDDFGWDKNIIHKFISLNIPLTMAIIPELKYSNYVAITAHKAGQEILVHLPMEAVHYSLAGHPLNITTSMSARQIQLIVSKSFKDIKFAVGLNNHLGSKATASLKVMDSVIQQLKTENKFFIDSNTIASSVGFKQAKKYHLKTARRDIFLDNSLQEADMQKQFLAAFNLANKNGSAVIIGHAHQETANFLKKVIPEFQKQGVKFVFSSQVVN